MRFTKMHGLGNDYVYVDLRDGDVADVEGLARRVSDRYRGVGGDGLILIGSSARADVRMIMYNADGSRSQMCGNGIRCVAKYAVDHGLARGPNLTIETDAGVKTAECRLEGGKVSAVRIDMGPPRLEPASLPCTLAGDRIVDRPVEFGGVSLRMTCVSMGNPHAVFFVEDPAAIDLTSLGPKIEHAPIFPERVNVHFARALAPDRVVMRTWERGAGATQACGTGACAVCVAGHMTGLTRRRITATLPGGDLELDWRDDDHVYKTGPAVEVFQGDWFDPS
ncbi:MAG: diaminopimelate epimerase [Planctomycetota bacterium]|nr:MAG: diaminopimelate epimerase [Planctomycetota bacterium]